MAQEFFKCRFINCRGKIYQVLHLENVMRNGSAYNEICGRIPFVGMSGIGNLTSFHCFQGTNHIYLNGFLQADHRFFLKEKLELSVFFGMSNFGRIFMTS